MEIRGSVTVKSTASDPVTRRGNRSGSYALQAFANSLGLKIEHGAHENEGHGGVNIGLDPVPGILDFSLGDAGYAVKIAHGLREDGEAEAAFGVGHQRGSIARQMGGLSVSGVGETARN